MRRAWFSLLLLILVIGCAQPEPKKDAKVAPAMKKETQSAPVAVKAPASPYAVEAVRTIGGEGRWDLLDVDPGTGLLYVPRSTHLMVVDAAAGKVVGDVPDTPGIHGAVVVPSVGRGFTSNGEGSVTVFDLKTLATLGKVAAADDADVILYDPASKRVLVFCGDANSMVAIAADVDPKGGKADGVVDLKGKPEAAAVDGKGHAYVNMVDKNEIVEVDTKSLEILRRWPTAPGESPVGMAIDAGRGQLFVSCRNQMMLAVDTATGKVIGQFTIGNGTDGAAFDDGYALASCGDGTLAVVREDAGDKFTVLQPVKTASGARTICVNTRTHQVYLPTADFGPAPAPTAQQPRPRPAAVPGSFKLVIVKR